MPGKVGVKIKAGRNLPVMDRGSDTTDAYVEIKLGNVTHKTDVCRKSLNPQWNTDWFRFQVDDAELQDEPLQIRLMDYDTYSANDAIGKVNISLNPLCLETSGQTTHGKGTVLSGWIPVFDTMHGIRGEVNVIVKVDLFSDANKFRQSSCGIPFFHSQCIPFGYRAQVIHGFVEELVVNDDPEYQWIDKIRTPRASNEARQVVFLKLSGQVQRKMGLKAINMGANAVIGYTQCFDLEGDVGVVARGIGTAVTLIKDTSSLPAAATDNALIEERTLKYLEFLTGASVGYIKPTPPHPPANIRKSRSTTIIDTTRNDLVADESNLMHELMRQEDERGEKPVKTLRDQMKRFTHSSRNLFSEKCSAIMRKIGDSADSKSPDSTSRSLTSIFTTNSLGKEGRSGSASASSTRSSRYEVRRKSFKAKNKVAPGLPVQRKSFKKAATPAMVRSVSDDSPIRQAKAKTAVVPCNAAIAEYQDGTRSSPNICAEAVQHGNSVELKVEKCSSNTLSPSASESSSSEEEEEDDYDAKVLAENAEERARVEKYLQICNDGNEVASINWIKPGESIDDSLPDVRQRYSLLRELRAFSHQVHDFIHTPKKHAIPLAKSKLVPDQTRATSERPSPPKTLPLTFKCYAADQQNSFYSSQPEISTLDCDANNILLAPNAQLTHSRSLINLTKCATTAFDVKSSIRAELVPSAATTANATVITANTIITKTFPVLKICPSTPTPSESENSQLSPNDCKVLTVPSYCSSSSSGSVTSLVDTSDMSTTSETCCPQLDKRLTEAANLNAFANLNDSLELIPNIPYLLNVKKKSNTNHSNIMNSSLLAPSLLPIKNHPRHHRSLNEISVAPAVVPPPGTDSPCMKRFGSPAQAAVAASAAAVGGGVPPPANTASNAASPLLGRNKLSPSPSKMAMTANNSSASQSDSISSTTTSTSNTTATTVIPKETGEMCRRSSDSDLSVTPKGNSLCVASERLVAATAMMRLSQPISSKNANADGMDMLEYPFLTMTKYPRGFILHLGATVAARSVKLLERVPNPDEPEVRDSWWTELRMEVRSHARALGCNVVLGYSESTTISDEVCVLSATGTAAVINMAYNRSVSQTDILTVTKPTMAVGVGGGSGSSGIMSASLEELKRELNGLTAMVNETIGKETTSSSSGTAATASGATAAGGKKFTPPTFTSTLGNAKGSCTVCHIPYNITSVPFNVKMKKCAICRKGRVPDVLLATLEVPEYLQVTGRGCFMQAQVVRAKKDLRSELNAKEISDGLPFLEYELHRVLINKLKAKGMNAIFGLRTQVAIGERMIALIATGTALFLTALPVPQVPKIVAGNSWTDKQKLNELQKKLQETFERNQEIYQLKCIDPDVLAGSNLLDKHSDTDESDDEVIEIDLNCGNKDTCVLEVDDIEDLEILSLLMEPYPPEGFHVVNTQMVPGLIDMEAVKNLQMFTQVWRAKLDVGQNINGFPKHFQRLLQTIYFKLRTMIPCAICDLRFRLDLPESDQIQLLVTGMALGLSDANKFKYRRKPAMTTNGTTINLAGIGGSSVTLSADAFSTNNNQTQDMNGAPANNKRALQEEDYIFPLDEDHGMVVETPTPTSNLPPYGMHSFKIRKTSPSRATSKANASVRNRYFPLRDRYGVDLTPLSFIPGGRIEKYLGNLNFFFIRETTSIRETGGISGFVHSFITELLAVVRAHITTLGGNAMVSFYMTELILVDNQHKNQGQCLISIGGDAVYVSYHTDD